MGIPYVNQAVKGLATGYPASFMSELQRKTNNASWIGFLAVLAFGLAFMHTPLSRSWDNLLLDAAFQNLRDHAPRENTADVLIIGIDQSTYEGFKESFALWHPYFAEFLQAMTQARPRVLGFDIVFPDRDHDHLLPGYGDGLRKALLKARDNLPVVYGITVDTNGRPRMMSKRLFFTIGGERNTGFTLWRQDEDRVVRRYQPELQGEDGKPAVTLVGAMARKAGLPNQSGLINYAVGAPMDYIPFHSVIARWRAGDSDYLRMRFRDQVVVVGTVLPFEDRHYMPVNLAAWEEHNDNFVPGMLFHAQSLRSMLNGGHISELGKSSVLALVLLASLLWWLGKKWYIGLSALLAWLVLALSAQAWGLYQGWYLQVAAALATAILAFAGRLSFEATLQARERRRLRGAFSGYVSPQVLKRILDDELDMRLGGTRYNICVLFSDIRGFTRRSESMAPEQVTLLLNRYFERMTRAVHHNQGTIDKFMGDGIMAFFGAPNIMRNPAEQALKAARAMFDELDKLNRELTIEGHPPVEIGVGLHIGEAVIGHVGSASRHEYTAIGDVVNVASRLESLTKDVGHPLLLSADVAHLLSDVELLELGEKAIKGHAPVEVLAPLEIRNHETEKQENV